MRVAVYDTHHFEKPIFEDLVKGFKHELTFFDVRLTEPTVKLAQGFDAVCSFANDHATSQVLEDLSKLGVRVLALRCAGYNQVDLQAAKKWGLRVVRVPAYSPYAIAEHAVGLLLALNRKICRANSRVHDMNFSLDGLVGFDLHGKSVGVIGTGRIGAVFSKIMLGFGCEVLAFDPKINLELQSLGVQFVPIEEIYKRADIISLHAPLNAATKHMIDTRALAQMKAGVFLINTSRGALIEAKALVAALKSGHIGAAGLDVYEEEENIFFQDLSEKILQDDLLARLLSFPHVLITSHQGFLTKEALHNIVLTTLQNLEDFELNRNLKNEVLADKI
jgi:D-lactate dehydrogenase